MGYDLKVGDAGLQSQVQVEIPLNDKSLEAIIQDSKSW